MFTRGIYLPFDYPEQRRQHHMAVLISSVSEIYYNFANLNKMTKYERKYKKGFRFFKNQTLWKMDLLV